MILFSLSFRMGGQCQLSFDIASNRLLAEWRGLVEDQDAQLSAQTYLEHTQGLACPYLLNDNTHIHGPWFNSLHWLQQVWLPEAHQIGLRYIAHVVSPAASLDVLGRNNAQNMGGPIDLQIFEASTDADQWLRSKQRQQMLR